MPECLFDGFGLGSAEVVLAVVSEREAETSVRVGGFRLVELLAADPVVLVEEGSVGGIPECVRRVGDVVCYDVFEFVAEQSAVCYGAAAGEDVDECVGRGQECHDAFGDEVFGALVR